MADHEPFIPAKLDDAGLDIYEFRVFCRIARRGACTESIPNMAEALGIGHNKVRDALATLVQRRFISRSERPGKSAVHAANKPDMWRTGPLPDEGGVTPTGSGSPTESSRGTPTGSGRGPLPDQVDEGTPTKVNDDEDDDYRAREDLDFLSEKKRRVYGKTISAVAKKYSPSTVDRMVRNQWGRKSGAIPLNDFAELARGHPWLRIVAATVITADAAQNPNMSYLDKVLNGFDEDDGHDSRRNGTGDGDDEDAAGDDQPGPDYHNWG